MRERGAARWGESGTTLIEVLIAVTLLALLSVGILMALRTGISAVGTANTRLMEERRVAGAQRILRQQLSGFVAMRTPCISDPSAPPAGVVLFFQGEPQSMRFVSTFSLQQAWRGAPHILEYQVIRGEDDHGVRLIVNEVPYTGPLGAGALCMSRAVDPALGMLVTRFRPIEPSPQSFVLADRLASCQFQYLEPPAGAERPVEKWVPLWVQATLPRGIRVEMVPLAASAARLPPITVTVPVRVDRNLEMRYVD